MLSTSSFTTRRLVVPFIVDEKHKDGTSIIFTATVSIADNDILQYCGISFKSEKENVYGAMIESIKFSTPQLQPLTGHTVMIRNGLCGIRSMNDKQHARTHITVIKDEWPIEHKGLFQVTMKIKQYTPQELKEIFSAERNADLFDAPELFVATRRSGTHVDFHQTQILPYANKQIKIPFVNMHTIKDYTIALKPLVDKMPSSIHPSTKIMQLWFTYSVLNIQTTASVFQQLQLKYKNEVVHTYSSPVQLQVIDKEIWNLMSPNANLRAIQEKYLTITLQDTTVEQLAECELHFVIHDQFYKDYTNWVNEDKNKLVEIKDAVIHITFGCLLK